MFQKPFLNVTLVIHVLWRYLWLVSSSMSRNHTHLHLSFKSQSMLEVRAWKQLLILFLWAGIIIFVPVIGGSVQAQNIFYSIDLSILGCKIQQKCQHSLPFNSIVIFIMKQQYWSSVLSLQPANKTRQNSGRLNYQPLTKKLKIK